MATLRPSHVLSTLGLVLLAIVTVLLSGAAIVRTPGDAAKPEGPAHTEIRSQLTEGRTTPPSTPVSGSTRTGTPEATPSDAPTVLVIGDSYSVGDPSATWIGAVAEALGWGQVTNVSSPGRGFVTAPDACEFTPCATFIGSIGLIAENAPDIVVTFGGEADGDYSLAGPADEYFQALRQVLPSAEFLAISPVTGGDSAPIWLSMHRETIAAAVEGVDGQFVDVGQPGIDDGDSLSASAHAEIAQRVIAHVDEAR